MKNIVKKFVAICLFAVLSVGCMASCTKKQDSGDSSSDDAFIDIVDSALIMDNFDTYVLDVETKDVGDITWRSSNPSVVSVDQNGCLTSYYAEGKCEITATSGNKSDSCAVTVLKKNATPALTIEKEVVIAKGGEYTITANSYYKGISLADYLVFSCDAVSDGADGIAEATVTGNTVKFIGRETGNASFTISTTIFGVLYAETIDVEVRNLGVVYVVSGKGAVDGNLQVRNDNQVFTSDIEIYDNDKRVPDNSLSWTIADDSIVTLGENGQLVMGNEGTTTLSTIYHDIEISVDVCVIKDYFYSTIEKPSTFDLNMDITVDKGQQQRNYTPDQTKVFEIALTEDTQVGKVVRAYADDEKLDVSLCSYVSGKVSIRAAAFGTTVFGEKTLKIEVESAKTVHVYTVKALIVTKYVTTLDEFTTAIVIQWKGDRILGYFALKQDLDLSWKGTGVWATDFNWSNGFRGTLDGMGYSIKNVKSSFYGLTAQLGEGAVFKNLKFPNYAHGGDKNALFARCAVGVTFDNIEITFTEDSACTPSSEQRECGVFISQDMRRCVYKDITINASGKSLQRIFGGYNNERNSSVYENVIIYAQSVEYYENDITVCPNGVTLIKG